MSWGRVSAKYGLWLLAFVLLGWLYRQSTQIDIDLHVRKVAYLEQLRQQDARLNQYVLQSRYGLLLNYDPLVASQQDIAHLLASLQTISPTLFGAGNSPLQQAFANYQNQFKDKFALVEAFKSHNAVLRNSARYLPLAVAHLLDQPGRTPQRDKLLHDVLESVLLFDAHGDEKLVVHIRAVMAALLAQEQPQREAVAQLGKHVEIILSYQNEVNQFTKNITQSRTAADGDQLFALYSQQFAQRQHQAEQYGLAVALLAAAMLAYVAWMLATLQQARKTLTESLRELEFQKYALDQHSIVSITDRSGKITYTNGKFTEVSQYSAQELLGQDHRLLNSGFHPHAFFKDMWATIGHGQVWHGEVKNRRKDGSDYWVDSTVVPFLDDAGKVLRYVSIRSDITERKNAEQAMLAAVAAAEQAARIKGDFLANMSHEIRTPMNGIIGMTQLALDTELNDEQREYISLVKTSADALLTVINDILDFSKIESGKMTVEVIEFSLEAMLRDTLKTLAVRAHQKGLELLLQVAPNVPDRVSGDPGRIRQVILNLIGNAIKFTEHGEIEVSIDADSAAPPGLARLTFKVRDTGIGIAPDKFGAIFDSFSQADTSTTRKYGGTGLGLTISSQLVALMGGQIQVHSELGAGSTFYFTLAMPITSGNAWVRYQKTGRIQGMPVLVVDDNHTNRHLLCHMLRNWHMQPTAVPNGPAALAELAKATAAGKPYALALLDMQMPGMDGFELAALMRTSPQAPAATVMMLTSQGQRGDAERCRAAGISSYLSKPVSQSDLLDAIMTALGEPLSETTALITQHSLRENRRKLNLLLAEDNPVNQKLAITLLQKQGHSVTLAHNGREALEHWQHSRFDAILMDVDMPEMNGFEATERIRLAETEQARGAHTPVIAMTAHAMQGAREECLSHGMDGYVSKPIHLEALWHEIDQLILSPAASTKATEAELAPTPQTASPASHLPVADFGQLRRSIDDNKDVFDELVSLYHTDGTAQRQKLHEALATGNAQALKHAAHALKGMVGVFAAEQAMAAAQSVENRSAHEDAAQAVAQLDQALDAFDQALQAYQW